MASLTCDDEEDDIRRGCFPPVLRSRQTRKPDKHIIKSFPSYKTKRKSVTKTLTQMIKQC